MQKQPVEGIRPYILERAPDLPPGIVSLMFQTERDLLYSIAKYYYTEKGDIIDAGIFMGSSTFCFALGLKENPRFTEKFNIHSYDRAIVTAGMVNYPSVKDKIGEPGGSFGEYLKHTISPLGDVVKLHIGDITEMSYDGVIEILFLDILKTWQVFFHCNKMFMGRLVPGHSLVVQQDYFWYENWYISAYMEILAEYFIVVDSAETSCVFLNTRAIPAELYEKNPLEKLGHLDIIQLLERSRSKAGTLFQYVMSELCIISYTISIKSSVLAQARLAALEAGFGKIIGEWKGKPSNHRAWAAYHEISRHVARLPASR